MHPSQPSYDLPGFEQVLLRAALPLRVFVGATAEMMRQTSYREHIPDDVPDCAILVYDAKTDECKFEWYDIDWKIDFSGSTNEQQLQDGRAEADGTDPAGAAGSHQ